MDLEQRFAACLDAIIETGQGFYAAHPDHGLAMMTPQGETDPAVFLWADEPSCRAFIAPYDGFAPRRLPLDDLIEDFLPDMAEDGLWIAPDPHPVHGMIYRDAREIADALRLGRAVMRRRAGAATPQDDALLAAAAPRLTADVRARRRLLDRLRGR